MSLDACPKQNLRVKRGTLLLLQIDCLDRQTGELLDMTGRTCRMQCRLGYGGAVLFEATSEGALPTITLATGLVTIKTIIPADAQLTNAGVYDIILTGDDGPECIGEGTVEITDKATELA